MGGTFSRKMDARNICLDEKHTEWDEKSTGLNAKETGLEGLSEKFDELLQQQQELSQLLQQAHDKIQACKLGDVIDQKTETDRDLPLGSPPHERTQPIDIPSSKPHWRTISPCPSFLSPDPTDDDGHDGDSEDWQPQDKGTNTPDVLDELAVFHMSMEPHPTPEVIFQEQGGLELPGREQARRAMPKVYKNAVAAQTYPNRQHGGFERRFNRQRQRPLRSSVDHEPENPDPAPPGGSWRPCPNPSHQHELSAPSRREPSSHDVSLGGGGGPDFDGHADPAHFKGAKGMHEPFEHIDGQSAIRGKAVGVVHSLPTPNPSPTRVTTKRYDPPPSATADHGELVNARPAVRPRAPHVRSGSESSVALAPELRAGALQSAPVREAVTNGGAVNSGSHRHPAHWVNRDERQHERHPENAPETGPAPAGSRGSSPAETGNRNSQAWEDQHCLCVVAGSCVCQEAGMCECRDFVEFFEDDDGSEERPPAARDTRNQRRAREEARSGVPEGTNGHSRRLQHQPEPSPPRSDSTGNGAQLAAQDGGWPAFNNVVVVNNVPSPKQTSSFTHEDPYELLGSRNSMAFALTSPKGPQHIAGPAPYVSPEYTIADWGNPKANAIMPMPTNAVPWRMAGPGLNYASAAARNGSGLCFLEFPPPALTASLDPTSGSEGTGESARLRGLMGNDMSASRPVCFGGPDPWYLPPYATDEHDPQMQYMRHPSGFQFRAPRRREAIFAPSLRARASNVLDGQRQGRDPPRFGSNFDSYDAESASSDPWPRDARARRPAWGHPGRWAQAPLQRRRPGGPASLGLRGGGGQQANGAWQQPNASAQHSRDSTWQPTGQQQAGAQRRDAAASSDIQKGATTVRREEQRRVAAGAEQHPPVFEK